MAVNKVRVVKLFGSESTLGETDPKVNMQVRFGETAQWITATPADSTTVTLSTSSGGPYVRTAYPFELLVSEPVATYFGWPGGNNSVKFTHSPNFTPSPTNTGVYLGGDGETHSVTFGS